MKRYLVLLFFGSVAIAQQTYYGKTITIPYQVNPLYGSGLNIHTYGSAFSGYHNIYQNCGYAKITSATGNTVACFGQGESALSGANVWGGNHVAITSAAGATGIADELDAGAIVDGTSVYGAVIGCTGYYPCLSAIQIQANRWAAPWGTGIFFNTSALAQGVASSGNLIESSNSTVATYAIKLPGIYAQEMYLPSFQVGATPTNKLISTSVTGNGTTATYTITSSVNFPWIGSTMTASGFANAGFNAACTVTASTATTASCLNGTNSTSTDGAMSISNPTITVTGASVSSGTVTLTYANAAATGYPQTGNKIIVDGVVSSGNVSGQNLTGYNGNFTVVTSSATQLTYADTQAAGTWVSGGTIDDYPVTSVVSQLKVLAATPPGNTIAVAPVSAGQGSTNANLQFTGQGTGLVSLGSTEMAAGTKFTVSDFTTCSGTNGTPTTLTGGAQAGSFVTASSGTTCKVVITPNGATGAVAGHGWWCAGTDITSGVAMVQTAKNQSTCTLTGTINGTSDVVVFFAMGY